MSEHRTHPPLPDAERVADSVREKLDRWHRGQAGAPAVWLRGGHGVGKSWVTTRAVARARERGLPVVDVRPPELGLDGVAQLSAQGAGSLREAAVNGLLAPVFDATAATGDKLDALRAGIDAAPQGLLAFDLHGSWGKSTERPDFAKAQAVAIRAARDILEHARDRGWAVLLTTERQSGAILLETEPLDIDAGSDGLAFLKDAARWGEDLAGPARRLAKELGDDANANTPLELRLAVGLVALPHPPLLYVAQACRGGLGALRGKLRDALRRAPPLRDAFQTLSLARFAVSERMLARVETSLDSELQRAVLRRSLLLEGDSGWLVHESLRDVPLDEGERVAGHEALIEELDARTISSREDAVRLLERHHHAASAGRADLFPESQDETLPDVSVLLQLGRATSLAGRYGEAADIYDRALALRPDDTYAKAYLAFNLDRAGRGRQRALELFRAAVEDEPDNPWWNRRLAVALLRRGRPKECGEAFRSATRSFGRSPRSPSPRWLADNFHVGLARELLLRAELDLAREVLSTADDEVRRVSEEVSELWKRLRHRERVEETGACVFPEDLPFEERWLGPHYFSEAELAEVSAELRSGWKPGRIVSLGEAEVELELGVPPRGDEPERYVRTSVKKEAFLEAANRRDLRDVHEGQFLDLLATHESAVIKLRSSSASPRRRNPWDILQGWKPDVVVAS